MEHVPLPANSDGGSGPWSTNLNTTLHSPLSSRLATAEHATEIISTTSSTLNSSTSSSVSEKVWDRRLLPTHLCYKAENTTKGYECRKVSNLVGDEKPEDFDYAFISYSRRQFFTHEQDEIDDKKELAGGSWDEDYERRWKEQIVIDRRNLIRIALKAIADSGLNAFYIDFECVDSTPYSQNPKAKNGEMKKKVCVIPSNSSVTYLTYCHFTGG